MNSSYIWKFLGVALILYSLIFGLLIPLKPGIVATSPSIANGGDTLSLFYSVYNVDYTKIDPSGIKAWLLINDGKDILADKNEVLSATEGRAEFRLPLLTDRDQAVVSSTLVVSDPKHGYALLPSALAIRPAKSTQAEKVLSINYQTADVDMVDGVSFPFRNILQETIRNTYYHVPLWFSMIILFAISAFYSARYLRRRDSRSDLYAVAFAEFATLLGILGLLTCAIWARFTWGAFWSWDIKQFTSAVALLIYFAYFILRSSVADQDKRARLTSSYNIFAFVMLIPLLFIVPRLTDSLHPGNGGNPAMGGEDLDQTMRWVFYPAVVGWILLGMWVSQLKARYLIIQRKIEEKFTI
jgi:heme exporter protein C